MSMRKQIMIWGVGAMMMAGMVGGMGEPVGAVDCPTGSVRTQASSAADCNVPETGKDYDNKETSDVTSIVETIVGVMMAAVGVIAVAAIVYGGAQMVTSQGAPDKIKTGKQALAYGVIGLVVAGVAWMVVRFVLAAVAG